MLEISPAKVAHVIVRAREYDAKVAAWEDPSPNNLSDHDADSILEDFSADATRAEIVQFIAAMNDDEKAHLVALAWIGRGSFTLEEYAEAVETAKDEHSNGAEDYLLGIPLLADYLEDGLDKLGYSVEDAEDGVL